MESLTTLQNLLNGFLKFAGPLLWIARFLFLTVWGWLLIILSSLLVIITNSFSRDGQFSPMRFFGNTIQGVVQFYFSIASVIIGLILLLLISFVYNIANDISKGISLYREVKMLEATLRNLKSERKVLELRLEYVQSGEVKMIKAMIQYYAYSPFQNRDIPSGYEEHLISGRKLYIGFGVINFDYSLIEKGEAKNIALNWLKKVNLNNPELIYNSYPFQLSGGMQQRVMIAMALACNPSLLIADEPTSSLDVISQNAILQMLLSLKDELNLSLIIISHDFSIIAQFATRILIMYKGRIVESSSKYELFDSPLHPYTKYLLSNLMDFKTNSFPTNQYIPKLIAKELTTSGCPFFELCQNHMNKCYNEFPSPFSFSKSHTVWCWLFLK